MSRRNTKLVRARALSANRCDPRYQSQLVDQLIRCLMRNGKRSLAERIVYDALDIVSDKCASVLDSANQQRSSDAQNAVPTTASEKVVEVLSLAIHHVGPSVEVRPRRVGGAVFQVPVEVTAARKICLAIRWLIQEARNRSERGMSAKLASEILDAARQRGGSFARLDRLRKVVAANQAFVHIRST